MAPLVHVCETDKVAHYEGILLEASNVIYSHDVTNFSLYSFLTRTAIFWADDIKKL